MGVSAHLLQGWSNDQPHLPQEHREDGNAESPSGGQGLACVRLEAESTQLACGRAPLQGCRQELPRQPGRGAWAAPP